MSSELNSRVKVNYSIALLDAFALGCDDSRIIEKIAETAQECAQAYLYRERLRLANVPVKDQMDYFHHLALAGIQKSTMELFRWGILYHVDGDVDDLTSDQIIAESGINQTGDQNENDDEGNGTHDGKAGENADTGKGTHDGKSGQKADTGEGQAADEGTGEQNKGENEKVEQSEFSYLDDAEF